MADCALCNEINAKRVFHDGKLCVALVPTFPISQFHCMVLPKRHITRLSEFTPEELTEIFALLARLSSFSQAKYSKPVMIEINRGNAASQPHMHFHVVDTPPMVGFRTYIAAVNNCDVYPPCTDEKMAELREEYRAFTEAELTD